MILTNDPSLTAWGWAVLNPQRGSVVDCGCIKTEPNHKLRRIRKSDDRTSRVQEIVIDLLQVINKYGINLLLSELPHGSQNASGAIMLGVVTGIMVGISECLHIPVEFYSEQDAKKALLSRKTATKEDTIKAISVAYPDWHQSGVKYKDEAVADALAVHYVASEQSTSIKIIQNEFSPIFRRLT